MGKKAIAAKIIENVPDLPIPTFMDWTQWLWDFLSYPFFKCFIYWATDQYNMLKLFALISVIAAICYIKYRGEVFVLILFYYFIWLMLKGLAVFVWPGFYELVAPTASGDYHYTLYAFYFAVFAVLYIIGWMQMPREQQLQIIGAMKQQKQMDELIREVKDSKKR